MLPAAVAAAVEVEVSDTDMDTGTHPSWQCCGMIWPGYGTLVRHIQMWSWCRESLAKSL